MTALAFSRSFTHALHMPSPVGTLELRAQGETLVAVFMEPQGFSLADGASFEGTSAVLDETRRQLVAYFARRLTVFDLPLAFRGTELQEEVWRTLCTVPFGTTWAYSDVARVVGRPNAVRAVGGAIGKYPIGIVVPCHRIVGKTGAITGYAGGVERKVKLLALEATQGSLLP